MRTCAAWLVADPRFFPAGFGDFLALGVFILGLCDLAAGLCVLGVCLFDLAAGLLVLAVCLYDLADGLRVLAVSLFDLAAAALQGLLFGFCVLPFVFGLFLACLCSFSAPLGELLAVLLRLRSPFCSGDFTLLVLTRFVSFCFWFM